MAIKKSKARKRRHRRIRARISGTAERPRLNVFRSLDHIYAQVIDDESGRTLVSASTVDQGVRTDMDGKTKKEQANLVGKTVAVRAKEIGIERVIFDRGGYLYHGRIQALADGARKAGLQF